MRLQLTRTLPVWLAVALAALEATATPSAAVEPISPAPAANASAVGPPVEVVSPQSPRSRSITGRVRGELSAYTDTDHVSVFTPSLTVEAADATKGWSAHADYLVDAVSAASVDIVSSASPPLDRDSASGWDTDHVQTR